MALFTVNTHRNRREDQVADPNEPILVVSWIDPMTGGVLVNGSVHAKNTMLSA
jgi:hypothetical protein